MLVHFLNFDLDLLMMLCMFQDTIFKNILGDKNILFNFCLKMKIHFYSANFIITTNATDGSIDCSIVQDECSRKYVQSLKTLL